MRTKMRLPLFNLEVYCRDLRINFLVSPTFDKLLLRVPDTTYNMSLKSAVSTLRRSGVRADGWICQSCRDRARLPQRTKTSSPLLRQWNNVRHSSTKAVKKPYYVTTPIFYVNAGQLVATPLMTVMLTMNQHLMSATYTP